LLRRAIQKGLAGETTLEGFLGLDAAGRVVEPRRWSLVQTRPLVLEFLDSPTAIGSFLPDVVEVVKDGLATLETVQVSAHRRRTPEASEFRAHVSNPAVPHSEVPPVMQKSINGQLLRIFVDESDKLGDKPLYRGLIDKAWELGMSNAIVLRASTGFGTHKKVHTDRSPDYVSDLPILIEIVGTTEEIGRFLPFLEKVVPEGLITVEDVKFLRLGSRTGT
jgi:PII-like signaling protein